MKQKILMTYVESGFGHISSMDSIYESVRDRFGDGYEIEKSFILLDDGFPNLVKMNDFIIKEVKYTNMVPYFGRFVFPFIGMLGGHKLLRFFHRQMAVKSFRQGLEAIKRRKPNIIITNHYFTDLLAVEYKRRFDPDVVVVNYCPDPTLHTFWDNRGGIFIVNNPLAEKKARRYKFKDENLRIVTPCVRRCVETDTLTRAECRQKFELPPDKFTVVIADGGYMMGRGPKFAKALIKKRLPITICVIAGQNKELYDKFKAIEDGKSKIKLAPETTLRTYEFLPNAYELYGAADVFLTKGGPNAVLDSIYMHTPVMIDYCPHVIEAGTAKVFIKKHGCGETVYRPAKAIRRIRKFMEDDSDLVRYGENINKLLAVGNGSNAVADIIEEQALLQRALYLSRGEPFDSADGEQTGGESVESIAIDDAPEVVTALDGEAVADERKQAVGR